MAKPSPAPIAGYPLAVAADPSSTQAPCLGPGTSAAAISEALLPEDRARFQAALRAARRDRDLGAEQVALERWRGIALLQADPERYAATVRSVAARKSGHTRPDDEPLSVSRRVAGL